MRLAPSRFAATIAVVLFALAGRSTPAAAQGPARAFSVYLDCSAFYCDPDFFRTDIAFVDHVREPSAADVHVLITFQRTGGRGAAYTLAFYGQRRFAGLSDTLTVTTPQGATEDEQRTVLSRTIKLGLARYLARTDAAPRAALAVATPAADAAPAVPAHDPWNAWVFNLGAQMNASREREFGNNFIYGSVGAGRVTERWKSNLRVYERYSDQSFTIDSETVTSVRRDFGGAAEQVRSLDAHWSVGATLRAGSSTFLNQHLFASAAPAVEYNLYPYTESTRHALTFRYAVGVNHFRYEDTTVYFRTRETRPFESLTANLSQKQTWGSLSVEIAGSHYLDDLSKSHLTIYPSADVRLFKGLSLNLFGNYTFLHDQLYLPKGTLTRDEVLLRRSQAATSYTAFLYMGLNYTFGSVLNNVVNTRFSSPSSEF